MTRFSGMTPFLPLLLLTAVFATNSVVQGEDSAWFQEIITPPQMVPAPSPPLRPLLEKTDGSHITTLEEWKPVRAELKQSWADFLGPLPSRPATFDLKSIQTDVLETVTRELVEYNVEDGRRVQAYVLRPKETTAAKRPALVVFHGTTPDTSRSMVGLGTTKPGRDTGLKLAQRGFVVICPANFLWEESSYLKSVAAAKKRNPQSLGMATMLSDGIRAVDLLLTFPDVDPQRVGTIGHSLGGKEALYLIAFDDRIQAGVASEGGIGLHSTNWEAPWYLGPAVKEPDFPRNHHELVALIAPRPFLVLGGETGSGCADGDRSWPYIEAGQHVTKLYGLPPQQGLFNHHEGHLFSPESQRRAFEWLEHSLPK
ncbi:MAG TPA: dienelactone hydrolase family protein [Planctomicrobium sp.]|nr:dienelactone hydrolase family protein [Planctomicrobium sp.]